MADRNQMTKIEEAILDVLRASGSEMSFSELLDGLKAKGWTAEGTIKTAMWPLISESVLELTDQRKLRLVCHS